MSNIVYCADVIAWLGNRIVIVERLGSIKGLALPGGKQDPGETLTETAVREFFEETGLVLTVKELLEVRAEPGRDPRGNYVSAIVRGIAEGVPRDETGKTKVVLFDPAALEQNKDRFVLDHARILARYLDNK